MPTKPYAEMFIQTKINNAFSKKFKEIMKGYVEINELNTRSRVIQHRINNSATFHNDTYRGYFGDILGHYPEARKRCLDLFKEYLTRVDETDYEQFKEDFYDLIIKKHSQETLVLMIAKDICQKIINPIQRATKENFNLKTGEMAWITQTPPMGMNEFMTKTTKKDIFDVNLIEVKK